MRKIKNACKAELLKLKGARIVWVTFMAFAIAPLMGGLFFLILDDPQAASRASVLSTKAEILGYSANWASYLKMLSQAMGVGGILVFGFVASWVFGREYTDGTVKDLLALPISRAHILHAKYIVYILWATALAVSNLLIGFLIGLLAGLAYSTFSVLLPVFTIYGITTLLTVILGPPIAFLALYGKGYLTPLGFLVIALVLSQIIAALGYGSLFPWSIPGLYSGLGEGMSRSSYIVIFLTGIAGYVLTIIYWNKADQPF